MSDHLLIEGQMMGMDEAFALGASRFQQGQLTEAGAVYREILRLHPDQPRALHALGVVSHREGEGERAVELVQRALGLKPDFAEAHNNLGNILKDLGRPLEAVQSYRRAVEVRPSFAAAHSNILLSMQYLPEYSAAQILEESLRHAAALTEGAGSAPPSVVREPEPARRLRVGYVSGDLGRHPVGYFMMPVLTAHDNSQVEVFCYSSRLEDDLTLVLKSHADVWRSTIGMSDADLERTIREDGIDILVDLSGHTAGNRLRVFAMKLAPIQVTWAGYVGTTGLRAIDYLISDWNETPEGSDEHYVEQIVRLPDGYICYSPPEYAPPVLPLPLERNGYPTFGCFNNLNKITPDVTSLWSRLLQRIPDARLVLVTRELGRRVNRERLIKAFAVHGVAGRVELSGEVPHAELLARYGDIDVALDPFPYSGGLTTLESLWMGVPVVTMGGDRFASRHSLSHLTTAGLPELIADGPQHYLETAEALGRAPKLLAELRAGLRGRMAGSPLCDGQRFTANLEAAYRWMWRRLCGGVKREKA